MIITYFSYTQIILSLYQMHIMFLNSLIIIIVAS